MAGVITITAAGGRFMSNAAIITGIAITITAAVRRLSSGRDPSVSMTNGPAQAGPFCCPDAVVTRSGDFRQMNRAAQNLLDQIEGVDQHPHVGEPAALELRELGNAHAH